MYLRKVLFGPPQCVHLKLGFNMYPLVSLFHLKLSILAEISTGSYSFKILNTKQNTACKATHFYFVCFPRLAENLFWKPNNFFWEFGKQIKKNKGVEMSWHFVVFCGPFLSFVTPFHMVYSKTASKLLLGFIFDVIFLDIS